MSQVRFITKALISQSAWFAHKIISSYSAVDDYLAYANSVGAFKPIIEAAPLPNPISLLREHDTGATCLVHYPADMLKMLSDGLRQHERVEAIHGLVRKASRSDKVSL